MIDSDNLKSLYSKLSKHSNYQIIPNALKNILSNQEISVKSRYEMERMIFLKTHLDLKGKKILDVGGNTGFFSFECLDAGATEIVYIEGNTTHATFVKEASNQLSKNIVVYNKYFNFEESIVEAPFDVVLLFNVIHHLGDDYGDKNISVERAKEKMAECINYFDDKTNFLVLQMGFCWKGDRTKLLFENGTKSEMIKFIEKAIYGKWNILHIGIPEIEDSKTIYKVLNSKNIERNDEIGEFRNRPIFILKKI